VMMVTDLDYFWGMIENKVANSKLITLDIAEEVAAFEGVALDIAPQLWQGIALKEKDFREFVSSLNTAEYTNKIVAIHCSADAIVPVWAYMLLALKLSEVQAQCHFSSPGTLDTLRALAFIQQLDLSKFQDKNVVIKGCTSLRLTEEIYIQLSQKLQPVANRIMYGEPCSTVPLFKR